MAFGSLLLLTLVNSLACGQRALCPRSIARLSASGYPAIDIRVASCSVLVRGSDIDQVPLNQNYRIDDVLIRPENRQERAVWGGNVYLAVERV